MILFNKTTDRKLKFWFLIPILLLEKLLSLFGYIPHLWVKYADISANIDTGKSFDFGQKPKSELKRVNLFYIKNRKLRISLLLSGIFKRWYIYKSRKFDERCDMDSNREIIYLTKDKNLKNDIKSQYDRLSDYLLNSNYKTKNITRYLKRINLEKTDFYKIEPQIFVIVAEETNKHETLKKERNKLYEYKKIRSLEKTVKKMIKYHNLFSNEKVYGVWDDKPVIHTIAQQDRIDLMKRILNSADDDEERSKLVNYRTWKGEYNLFKKPIDYAKSEEMKTLLKKWEDLSKYDRYRKIMKIKKGIKK